MRQHHPAQAGELPPLWPGAVGQDTAPLRHQVWELPEIKPHVTEYQRHRLACPRCGGTTCAALPPGVPAGQSGPRLVAFAGPLMAYFRQINEINGVSSSLSYEYELTPFI